MLPEAYIPQMAAWIIFHYLLNDLHLNLILLNRAYHLQFLNIQLFFFKHYAYFSYIHVTCRAPLIIGLDFQRPITSLSIVVIIEQCKFLRYIPQ